MELKNPRAGKIITSVFLLFILLFNLDAAPIKVKVILDNASIKASRSIGGRTLIRVPLNTILDAEEKQGNWYRVVYRGTSGWIYNTNVQEVTGAAAGGGPGLTTKTQPEIVAEIGVKMSESTKKISQERNYDEAIDSLWPLVAKAFTVTDKRKEKELATEIFYWMGVAHASKGDSLSALREFRNMYEVDYSYAKTIVRLNPDPRIVTLTEQADKEFRGLITEYSLEITTDPKEATIKINGEEIGLSPEIYRTTSPEVVVELEKKGYKPIRDEFFITHTPFGKSYTLERAGRSLDIKSNPVGARVFLDGEDTSKVTNCVLPAVAFGNHTVRIVKEKYSEWEGEVDIQVGEGNFPLSVSLTPISYKFIHKWGSPVSQIFKDAAGVAVDSENNVYVANEGARQIQKITSDWKFDNSWGKGGKEAKVIRSPGGIAIDKQGNIFVTDVKSNCVYKFNKDGEYKIKWGVLGQQNHQFSEPKGIATDSKGNVYIVDYGNNRVKKYGGGAKLLRIWGRRGAADGEFYLPAAVAVNSKDEVFVLDRNRVQKFTNDGRFLAKWGRVGSSDGAFRSAQGMFIDKDDFVYIADSGNNRILKFDENGKQITKWGSSGTGEGQMMNPISIAVDARGYVYIVEKDNNRVQLFGVDTE
ncbi:MAG: PEGA domain-containing protein [Candidatus Aminicenantes bacterium]